MNTAIILCYFFKNKNIVMVSTKNHVATTCLAKTFHNYSVMKIIKNYVFFYQFVSKNVAGVSLSTEF